MKRILTLGLVVIMSAALFVGCSDDDDTPVDPGNGEAHFGSVSGEVHASARSWPLGNVAITVGGVTSQTNEQGWFMISQVPVGDATVEMVYEGYLTGYENVSVLENQTTHIGQAVMLPTETVVIQSNVGGDVTAGDGDGSVGFGADTFENEDGTPYDGDVDVEITAMLPDDEDYFEAFPGDFEGIREDGSTVQFVSFGFMGVNLYGENRAPLNLADGTTADVTIQISEEVARAAPDTIPLWYFDDDAGVWREEGFAWKDGTEYKGEVSHFTIWNWDFPLDDLCTIEGYVTSNRRAPVADARVISQGVGIAYRDEAYTDAAGFFSVRAIKNTTDSVWAIKGSYASEAVLVEVGEECPVVLADPLELLEPAFSITTRWGENPRDLDSHLFIPMTWDAGYDFYHIAYYNMGTLAENPFTALDTDDVTSYGPEIISGFEFYEGTYSYWVHHYSGTSDIPSSPTTVDLEIAGQYRQYNASDATGDNYDDWHVFDFTVDGAGAVTVTDVNVFEPWDYSGYSVYEGYGRGGTPAKPIK